MASEAARGELTFEVRCLVLVTEAVKLTAVTFMHIKNHAQE